MRIIAGHWRGRRLPVPDLPGLRPTPDRVRETLFNWLAPVIDGARCLDLFAGSGVLGFEAASRGASEVVMVERDTQALGAMRAMQAVLEADTVDIIDADAPTWLAGEARPFDVVFLDPPYGSDLLEECAGRLEDGGWLAPAARIYVERDANAAAPALPADWSLQRDRRAGDVGYALAIRKQA